MRAAICDDDNIWCERAEQIIRDYAQSIGQTFEISCFTSGQDLLKSAQAPDVVFLDIVMETEEADGIATAARVHETWPACHIVFLTDYISYATEVYHTPHTFYMLKDLFAGRVEEIFEKIYHEQARREKKLCFTLAGGKMLCAAPNEILYFERIRRSTRIVTVSGRYETTEGMGEIAGRLPLLDFVRCHNSYIVYFPAVRIKRKDGFTMNNGDEVVISRFYQKSVQKCFVEWAKRQ